MKLEFNLRLKIFLIAVLVIVTSQIIYAKKNVDSFQESYLITLKEKSEKLGTFLKKDVEYILNLNIPITKLIKLENTLKDILYAFPELKFIEITDLEGFQLYYADHRSIGRIAPMTKKSAALEKKALEELKYVGISKEEVDVVIPVYYLQNQEHVGNITLRILPESFLAKSRQILWDMITVILTSLLITFEFLSFFVAFAVVAPLEQMNQGFKKSIFNRTYVVNSNLFLIRDLSIVSELFNHRMGKLFMRMKSVNYVRHIFPTFAAEVKLQITAQKSSTKELMENVESKYSASLKRVARCMENLQQKMDQFYDTLMNPVWLNEYVERRKKSREKLTTHIPYAYIRPMIFLFVMADGFCVSFLPMYVETIYQPLWGLSKEVVLGLPISAFMLFLALSMPVTGYWSDKIGWYRPVLVGVSLNAIGLLFTALSTNMVHLLIARSVTAIGFGMVYMGCQKFIFDNTSIQNRSLGMASFLAAFFGGDICGTVMGGMLADRIGYSNVFILSAVIAFLALICCWLIFKNDPRIPKYSEKKTGVSTPFLLKDAFRVLKDPEFSAVVFLLAIPAKLTLIGFLYYFIPLYLKKMGTLQSDIGRVIMCYGIALVFLGPFFSKYFDKVHLRKYYVVAGGLLTGFSMISFLFFSGSTSAFWLVVILGFAHTMSTSSQVTVITETRAIKKLGAGTGMGLFRFWERIGNILGPLLMGFLIAKWSYEQSVIILGFISITGSTLYIIFLIVYKPKLAKSSLELKTEPNNNRSY